MRKFLIPAAVAAGAMTIAAPAAAQWAPPPPVYGAPYGNAYGYNNHGQFRSLQVRIDRLEREIRRLDQRNILSNREAARLRAAAPTSTVRAAVASTSDRPDFGKSSRSCFTTTTELASPGL